MQPDHQPTFDASLRLRTKHIRAAGFSAAVDACVTERSEIWFLSLLGNQQSIRALWARLVKGEMAYLADDQFAVIGGGRGRGGGRDGVGGGVDGVHAAETGSVLAGRSATGREMALTGG